MGGGADADFSRLRRIKQLGFSELVYPGATHSRFAHSLGVFHTARQLLGVVENRRFYDKSIVADQQAAQTAIAAALLHDVGHNPFSHAFESVGRNQKLKFIAEHELISEKLIKESEIGNILNGLGAGFAQRVSEIVRSLGTQSIYSSIVSSQFDADRLDYMRRDRLMTGTQHGAIDFDWLLANLEVGKILHPDSEKEPLVSFIINHKALFATESYIQSLMQLYSTVYFHKTTRSAEVMFSAMMEILFKIDDKELEDQTGLNPIHPLYKWIVFYKNNKDNFNSEIFLTLDDSAIWGSFAILASGKNKTVSFLADSLQKRKLYKCIDVRKKIQAAFDPENTGSSELSRIIEIISKRIEIEINKWKWLEKNKYRILQDDGRRAPYKKIYKENDLMQRIYVHSLTEQPIELNKYSSLVKSTPDFVFYRVYYEENDVEAKMVIEEKVKEGLGYVDSGAG